MDRRNNTVRGKQKKMIKVTFPSSIKLSTFINISVSLHLRRLASEAPNFLGHGSATLWSHGPYGFLKSFSGWRMVVAPANMHPHLRKHVFRPFGIKLLRDSYLINEGNSEYAYFKKKSISLTPRWTSTQFSSILFDFFSINGKFTLIYHLSLNYSTFRIHIYEINLLPNI